MRLGVAQAFCEVQVGDGEAVCDEVGVCCQMRLQPLQRTTEFFGADAYGGINVFEGTTPVPAQESTVASVMEGVDPSDSGVDITKLVNPSWRKLI